MVNNSNNINKTNNNINKTYKKSLKIPKGGNQNPYIEEQTTQWPKEKVQKDKQRSTIHTYKTKDRVTGTPLKTGGELRCSGRVGSSCSTSDTRRSPQTTEHKNWPTTCGVEIHVLACESSIFMLNVIKSYRVIFLRHCAISLQIMTPLIGLHGCYNVCNALSPVF